MIICVICKNRIDGSSYIDLENVGQIAICVTIHMIDAHWEIVNRIRATTNDHVARTQLVLELASELYPST
jgi:hypothetical protein